MAKQRLGISLLETKPMNVRDDNLDHRLIDISIVPFTNDHIRDVAIHAGVGEEEVRAYLGDARIKHARIESSFHWITGMYPCRLRTP